MMDDSSDDNENSIELLSDGSVNNEDPYVDIENHEDVNEDSEDDSAAYEVKAESPVQAQQRELTVTSPKDSEEDGQICTICFEPWTSSNEHRLVSLRCGHLFGRSCISKWLKGQSARCPQCNARARRSEIRNIYAKAVKVLDSSERDRALEDLSRESELRRKAEIAAAQERLKHMMAVQECERLKKELMEANKMLQEFRSSGSSVNASQSSKCISSVFTLEKSLEISKRGGCRIVDACDLLGMILVSQPSTNDLFPGYGFRKISTLEMKPSEFVLVHQKPIRDMAFHVHDGLVLTSSIDKTFRITNVITNSVVQTYNVQSDAWCCAWDADDPVYFYGGVKTGEVYMYDIRNTSDFVYELPRFGLKTPIVSLQYLRSSVSHCQRLCGPMVGKLTDGALYQKTEVLNSQKIVPLPTLGPLTSLSTEPSSGHFLVSCRPSVKQPRINHTLCEFTLDSSREPVCNIVQTILGGKSQVQLTRSKVLKHPQNESSLLICAGDEDAHGALIWDGSSGSPIDNLKTDLPVLDLTGLKINHKSFLTVLTDQNLRLYSWTGQ